ncbi:transporter substrate-binding domain-containing protein [Terasakiella sp. A23]|uniref:substrate-binding periplasmic protein n=1 Tax=Terasakiella sp. FCG-A23 TaxID=3080561 RepID=UPI002955C99B|nr:transporter substrate-binding domain-containing protein [Terasakiella sp. A23]MDV7340323.1 transporter substrate-binding domain-containing protein [Terasakiella sp. A23]
MIQSLWRFCLFLMFALVGAERTHAHDISQINMPDLEWMPYFIKAENQVSGQGYAMDMLQKCFDEDQIKVKHVATSMKRAMQLMRDGSLDLWVFSHRKGREDWLEYSEVPLLYDGYGVFVRADSDFKYTEMKDLIGLKVGTLLGLKVSDEFQQFNAQHGVSHFSNERGLLLRLIQGHIDVAVIGMGAFSAVAKLENALDQIKLSGKPIRAKNYFATVSKRSKNITDRKAFLRDLDNCLSRLKSSIFIDGLYETYFAN